MEKKGKRILSVSLAAAGLLASATSALGSVTFSPIEKPKTTVEDSVTAAHRTLPSLLVLKSANGTQQVAQQHDSHASHSSHHSHHSHHSHTSHSSHTSGAWQMPGLSRMPDGSFVARFDRNVYRLSAVKKAAYKYGNVFHVLIEEDDGSVVVSLGPTSSNTDPEEAVGRFCNEVLDQELREEIAAETNGIRDLLLAQAFSKTSLIDSELETSDYEQASPSSDCERQ
jgi:His-Xaa-Ser system protein HxsD